MMLYSFFDTFVMIFLIVNRLSNIYMSSQKNNMQANTFTIRQAVLADWQLLQQIGSKTFYETFAQSNTEEDMQKYLNENFSEKKVKDLLTDVHTRIYLALQDETPIGYLKINFGPSQTELQDDNALEVERIYVQKQWQGKGLAKELFEQAMSLARKSNIQYVWLGVWEHNPRAIRFYEKNGFVAFDKHIFKLGNDEQTDILMKLVLK